MTWDQALEIIAIVAGIGTFFWKLIEKRFDKMEERFDKRFDRIEHTLTIIEKELLKLKDSF